MKKFALYHPFSGKYVSNLSYDRKRYNFKLTHNLNEISIWRTKSGAEAQARRLFAWYRNVVLEVKELR